MHKSFDKFEFQTDPATDYEVSCILAPAKSIYNTALIFELILFIRAAYEDNRIVLDEFEFCQIRPQLWVLAALECLEKFTTVL